MSVDRAPVRVTCLLVTAFGDAQVSNADRVDIWGFRDAPGATAIALGADRVFVTDVCS